jgi:dTDP-4-amino-4,6-dideoxygalactose transaminase
MFDVQAALLLPQLGRLEPRVAALEAIAVQYRARLAGTEGIELPRVPPGTRSGHHLFTVWVPGARRDSILRRLGERGIGVGVHYRALHTLAYFRQRLALPPDSLPQALRIGEQTISLPFYPSLTAEETAYVARSLREALAGA